MKLWKAWALRGISGKILPGADAHEYATQYARADLAERLRTHGCTIQNLQYVAFCEIIFQTRKPTAEEAMGQGAKP